MAFSDESVIATRRSNPAAALLLIIGGAAGILQAFVPWDAWSFAFNTSSDGLDVSALYRVAPDLMTKLVGWGIWVALIGGIICVLAGLAAFGRSGRSISGLAALAALLMLVAAVIYVIQLIRGSADISNAGLGFYLFMGSGLVALVGASAGLRR